MWLATLCDIRDNSVSLYYLAYDTERVSRITVIFT